MLWQFHGLQIEFNLQGSRCVARLRQTIMPCMARMLFAIKDRFEIEGRGVVVVPGLAPAERLWIGDPLEIRRPDGTNTRTRIAGLELLSPRPKDHAVPILFPPELTKDDLPLGAEVWSVDP